ncbi:MAG: TlpA disulfide reductase family protein [Bacteroidota bacterium]
MKKFILIVLLFVAFKGYAQVQKTTTKITDKTIVKDQDGTTYPYAVWSKLLESGLYSLKPTQGDEFLLHRLTPEQAEKNIENRKKAILEMPKPRGSEVFVEGEKFRADRFTSLDNTKFDLKKVTDKIYVLNFWFINCPPCKKEIPELNNLVKQYKDNKEVVFLAIALDQNSDLKDFLKTMPFDYNIIPDGRYYAQKYGVKSYPTHVIIGKDGLIKFSTIGLAPNTVSWIGKTIAAQL